MKKLSNGYDWNSRQGEYKYLKSTDSQNEPFKIIKQLIDADKIRSVLDIGCFTGAMAELIHDTGIGYLGIDASNMAIEEARRRVDLPFEVGEMSTYECKEFDLIYVGGVFIYAKPRYNDAMIERYLHMCKPKYILCSDVIRRDYQSAYPFLNSVAAMACRIDYRIDSNKNSDRFLCLFRYGKEAIV